MKSDILNQKAFAPNYTMCKLFLNASECNIGGKRVTEFPNLQAGKYFVSHSYKDAAVRDTFLKSLPPQVTPYIFPPISVSPLEFVSSTLIGAILACDALIYLNEGFSSRSFWVAFERDYARRAGKAVFFYTPSTDTFVEHTSPPLDLAIFPSFSFRQDKLVRPILAFMKDQRFFDPWMELDTLDFGNSWADELQRGIGEIFLRGGYVVSFIGSFNSEYVIGETKKGLEQERLIVAGLDVQPPEFILEYDDLFIQLMENGKVNNNRIDDLIVRLYWLMFRVQFPQYLYE